MKKLLKTVNLYDLLLCICFLCFTGCSSRPDPDYLAIRNSNLTGDELLTVLIAFDASHPNHFECKVDLATFYLALNDFDTASFYLSKAKNVEKHCGRSPESKKSLCIYYGTTALLKFNYQNYEDALKYADKAIKTDKETGNNYRTLKGKILYAQGKVSEAVQYLEEVFSTYETYITPADYLVLSYALSASEDFTRALDYGLMYYESGNFSAGLGTYLSNLYEKLGDYQNSILFAFLDYEYARRSTSNDELFYSNLSQIDALLTQNGAGTDAFEALNLVRSRFNQDIEYEALLSGSNNPIARYIKDVNTVRDLKTTDDVLDDLIKLEYYFSNFPSYYWTSSQALIYTGETGNTLKMCLQKCILLDSNGMYSQYAQTVLAVLK